MNIEELKLIVELFGAVTDGAITGVVTYFAVDIIKLLIIWGFSTHIATKVLDKLPSIKRASK